MKGQWRHLSWMNFVHILAKAASCLPLIVCGHSLVCHAYIGVYTTLEVYTTLDNLGPVALSCLYSIESSNSLYIPDIYRQMHNSTHYCGARSGLLSLRSYCLHGGQITPASSLCEQTAIPVPTRLQSRREDSVPVQPT